MNNNSKGAAVEGIKMSCKTMDLIYKESKW